MTRFERGLKFVLKWEGSKFTNDPDDRGGPTRYGITQKKYDLWRKVSARPVQSVEFISKDEYELIYRQEYWRTTSCDQMPNGIDLFLFDSAVQHGPRNAIRFLQRALAIDDDGVIGKQTMGSVREEILAGCWKNIIDMCIAARRDFYDEIVKKDSTQSKFIKGWGNRLQDLHHTIIEEQGD